MTYTRISPRLFEDFNCIAEECPANCCRAGWSITWTSAEYEHLSAVKEVSRFFCGDDYRTIKPDENGECPFLTAQGLCGIQKELGEEYLSYTCRKYPRISRLSGRVMLCSCKPTCYAVLDRLFSDRDCMRLRDVLTDEQTETILSENDGRVALFSKVRGILWGEPLFSSLDRLAHLYNVEQQDIPRTFAQRYGFELITGESRAEEFAVRNVVLALFMHWMINGYRPQLSEWDNIAEFLFQARAVVLAVEGASAVAEDREQLLCSVGDIIAVL